MNSNEITGALTLKIKAMSLQDEAKYIIRLERRIKRNRARATSAEHQAEHSARLSNIQDHRRKEIRREARSTHLARMLLKGTEYLRVEGPTCRSSPNWERVSVLLGSHLKEDSRVIIQRVKSWSEAAGGSDVKLITRPKSTAA